MIIKTKSIRDLKKDTDVVRLLVARYPIHVKRSYYDLWYPALAPSQYLLQKWKNREITRAHLETLREISTSTANPNPSFITLLCYEAERNPHCHRHILKNIIEGR